ncbi:MAG: DNA polymerase I [Candidatus Azotimanducaceae bacterium]
MKMKNDYHLVLVDGSSYLFRAYHALPDLISSKGQPTGAIKGTVSMIRRLMSDYPDSEIVVVFDAKGKTFRNEIYSEYKANRPPMPEDLKSQISKIQEIILLMGLPMLSMSGVEADDVLGTLAAQASERNFDTLISTMDKDLAQLVSPSVTLLNTMTGNILDEAGVKKKFGVRPNQMIDYLALVGDSADNIPGVPKCGPKTAVKWLEHYGSLENLLSLAHEIKGKVGENLRESLGFLPMSFDLATIREDLNLDESLDSLKKKQPQSQKLLDVFKELEFKNWAEELTEANESKLLEVKQEPVPNQSEYKTILTYAELDVWLNNLKESRIFALDTETTDLDYMEADLVGISFCSEIGKAAYVPLTHNYENCPAQLSREEVLNRLSKLLVDPEITIVGQNIKYDLSVLAKFGLRVSARIEDTMLQSYVLNSVASRHNMDDLALKYLGISTTSFEDIAGKGVKQTTFDTIDIQIATDYASEDADITFRLYKFFISKLEEEPKLKTIYEEIELPLVKNLSQLERKGVLIDKKLLTEQSSNLKDKIDQLEKKAYALAEEEFNLGSPKQLIRILYERLELPILKKTPKGQPSTAESVLQELAYSYPLPKLIIEYRALSKLKSTYTDQLPRQIFQGTGRVHTSYHQAVTATGRLSSSNPNLQNIPIRSEEGRQIRKAFIAKENCKIIAADYSQIELRIMAHLSGDQGLISAFKDGLDIHKTTASEIFQLSLDEVTEDHRRKAKAINFGLIYGMSAFGLSKQLSILRNEAQDYIDSYFARYPGVLAYMERIKSEAAENGYVETLYGRRLYLSEIRSSNFHRRQAAERTAINAPMQGTAADIIKLAMISVDRWLEENQLGSGITMQVHDELVLEVPISEVELIVRELPPLMENAATLSIPLIVDLGLGRNWDEAH